ncbi:hypothetical protein U9M48_012071 [Paspalum notatum var. saurae]|uniref:Uncharacterized protein n=1 Tax=Paspalum notatum var. saurae TaxID=547442 RepID=A0AAQ3WHZ7_PASNO
MAEAIAISISAKLGVALSRSAALGISGFFGVRSDIAAAIQDLDLLRAFLRFADYRRGTGAADHVAKWLGHVRRVAFELEDVADEWSYLSGKGLAQDCVNVKAWYALSRRLRRARQNLRRLFEDKEQYGIRLADGGAGASVAVTAVRGPRPPRDDRRPHLLEKEEVVGFAVHERQLTELLTEEEDAAPEPRRRRALVAVCGMGGVGKTTLVTRVYERLVTARRFDCAAWVVVSKDYTVVGLLQEILRELHRDFRRAGSGSDDGTDDAGARYRWLVVAVRERLAKQRYLVVLDDVWNARLWSELRHALRDDEPGSRVVITTRRRDVAMAAAPERIKMLEPLREPEAWELFCAVAFRDVPGRACPSHLTTLATSMLERCGGLPLAIVTIGDLLALKEPTEFAWRNARDSLLWDTSSSDLGIGEAASILNLSIDDLPHHLKKCFLSCSGYPEDMWIKRKILIRNWVAQGLAVDEQQRRAEDVADDYLDQIVQRNLVQVVQRNEFGRVKRFTIHDLIRDLIIHKSREEEGFLQLLKGKVTMDCNARIRHLVVDRCGKKDSKFFSQWSTLRTFTAYGSGLGASTLSHIRLLTLLNLWFIEIKKLPDSLTNLHNLRYLGIRSTPVEELPEELGRLQKLQTLDAKLTMVQRLPSSVAKLKSLRHLIVLKRETTDLLNPYPGMAVQVPHGLENLTSLQTLKYVQAHKKVVRSLAALEQLRSLELSGVNTDSLAADLSSSISRLGCLQRLGLETEHGADSVLKLESISPPPMQLQMLSLTGRLEGGKLPSWTCSLTSLVQLRLCRCRIAHDSLVLLAALPRLVNLGLKDSYDERDMVFFNGGFLALQKLTLEDLPNLSHIEFQEGCLVNLRGLALGRCTKLTEAPQGMEKLEHLKNNVELFGMPTEFVDKLEEQNGGPRYLNPSIKRIGF